MGFYCTHAYAHCNYDHAKRIPFALKGVDVIVHAVFASLGLRGKVRPVLARSYHTPKRVHPDSEDEDESYYSLDSRKGGKDGKKADPKKLVLNYWYPTRVTGYGRSRQEASS